MLGQLTLTDQKWKAFTASHLLAHVVGGISSSTAACFSISYDLTPSS